MLKVARTEDKAHGSFAQNNPGGSGSILLSLSSTLPRLVNSWKLTTQFMNFLDLV